MEQEEFEKAVEIAEQFGITEEELREQIIAGEVDERVKAVLSADFPDYESYEAFHLAMDKD